jgi:hypothetical protein
MKINENRTDFIFRNEKQAEEFLEKEFYQLTQFLFENQINSYTR